MELTMEYDEQIHGKDCMINELKNKLVHAEALPGRDSTNTGSRTPADKKKHIPNARVKTGKKKGGQPGHEKHVLKGSEESEVTDIVVHGGGGDGVLALLTGENIVIHDHNTLNYNKKFYYENIECCQHLERDLQKNSDDTKHIWSTEIKKLIGKAIKDQNERMTQEWNK